MKKAKTLRQQHPKVKPVPRENKRYPGKLNYTGPDKGWFAFVHHGKMFEHTNADGGSIKERVHYVLKYKPKDERAIRLDHIMYLGPTLNRKLTQIMRARGYVWSSLDRCSEAVFLVQQYIAKHKPKNKWNDTCGSLMKANGHKMHG